MASVNIESTTFRALSSFEPHVPHLDLDDLPIVLLPRQPGFRILVAHSFGKLVDVAEHGVAVLGVLECDEQVADVCLAKGRRVLQIVLLDGLVLLLEPDRAPDWALWKHGDVRILLGEPLLLVGYVGAVWEEVVERTLHSTSVLQMKRVEDLEEVAFLSFGVEEVA